MGRETITDTKTGRKCYLDLPSDWSPGDEVTFLLNLHGGGSVGGWQREYFPAHDYADRYRLVVAAPSAATKEPTRHWAPDADNAYLVDLAEDVLRRLGPMNVRAFWLVGHSQGGMTSHRLLATNPYFAERVDGWLSLSGGRLGLAPERVANFGPPRSAADRAAMEAVRRRMFQRPPPPTTNFSFIYATGEHEIVSLPETSPWADRYRAGARVRLPDVVDDQAGRIHDGRWDDNPTLSWGRKPAPGTAQVYVYPDAKDGRVIADVVRLDKGHTEGLEPRITEELIKLVVSAPGGKLRALV
ncbi:MAG TPA: alpha/beta fold hydrolase [Acidimicrobiales bacterium]|nr:alpha/beta fold hydrolase [Acidimicrobiales bacterium]